MSTIVSETIAECLDADVAKTLRLISNHFETHGVPRDMTDNGLLFAMIGHFGRTASPDQLRDVCNRVQHLEQQDVMKLVADIMHQIELSP